MHQAAARKRPGNQWDDDLGQLVPTQQPAESKVTHQLGASPFLSPGYREQMIVLTEDVFECQREKSEWYYDNVFKSELREYGCHVLRRYDDLRQLSKKPQLLSDVIAWKTGSAAMNDDLSITDIAKKNGVRKQDVQQLGKKVALFLSGVRSISQRLPSARRKMKLRNCRVKASIL